jgi:hypothetical protein
MVIVSTSTFTSIQLMGVRACAEVVTVRREMRSLLPPLGMPKAAVAGAAARAALEEEEEEAGGGGEVRPTKGKRGCGATPLLGTGLL